MPKNINSKYMNSVLGLNYFVFCILVLILVLFFTKDVRDEGFDSIKDKNDKDDKDNKKEMFGMSPGTMDQLSSTRVEMFENIKEESVLEKDTQRYDPNRKPEQGLSDLIQANLTKQALQSMTEPKIEAYEENPIFAQLYENLNYVK
jgi:hypothetical protein